MNVTMEKFGYPDTVIREYEHWSVQLRPQQATLGALVLCCKQRASRFGEVTTEGFTELAVVVSDVESALKRCFDYEKINYLMLMMVDPDVHYHVFPRYGDDQSFDDVTFEDPGWPGPPRLDAVNTTNAVNNAAILKAIKDKWPT